MTHPACPATRPFGIVCPMKASNHSNNAPNWVSAQLKGTVGEAPAPGGERREPRERRSRVLWSVMYGSFNPRRRAPPRRLDDTRYQSIDWHASHLLAVTIGILLLSVADALMTVRLLAGGAIEVNPVMAAVIYRSATAFAALKMALTGMSLIVMVLLARYRFLRVVRVDVVMYLVFFGYLALLGYEYWLTKNVPLPSEL